MSLAIDPHPRLNSVGSPSVNHQQDAVGPVRTNGWATSASTSRIPLNAAWSPNDAQIESLRRNSQPSARAIGTPSRTPQGQPNASPR